VALLAKLHLRADALFNGSCATELDICFNRTCIEYTELQEGDRCITYFPMCVVGLVCVPAYNESEYGTCENIPEGTLCTSDNDCESITQNCLCVAASDNSSMQCVNYQFAQCEKLTQLYNACSQNYCMYYDMTPGTPCYSSCYQYYTAVICCTVCNNQQYYDNAIFNYVGNCVDNTLKEVECCEPIYPCNVLSLIDMCAGYV